MISSTRALASDPDRSVCIDSTSSICSPTRRTGLSAVMGSWKIIAIRCARSSRIWLALAAVRSRPSRSISPPCTSSASLGNSPITASDVTDLPDPLSPTRQCVSPARISRSISSSTGAASGRPVRPTFSLWIFRTRSAFEKSFDLNSISALSFLHAGVEYVARGVPEQVDGQDAERQQQARPENQPRLDLEVKPSLGHDISPGGDLGGHAGPQETQQSLDKDGRRADIGALNDQRRKCVGHQVLEQDLGHR